MVLVTYISTLVFGTLILAFISNILMKRRNSMDQSQIIGITERMNIEMIIWADDFSYVFINRKLREILGLPDTASGHKAAVWKAFGLNEPDKNILQEVAESQSYEAHFKAADTTMTTIAWSTSMVKKKKKTTIYVSTGFNLTELKKMRVNLASANDFFNSSMELAEIGILMSVDKRNFRASPELVKKLGLKSGSISAAQFRALVHPNDRVTFDNALRSADSNEVRSVEMRIKIPEGIYRWFTYRFKSIEGTDNTLPLFGGAVIDITNEHEKDVRIEQLVYIDDVTKAANRNKLLDEGNFIYESSKLLHYNFWIIVLDIDRFHIVNDTCGYVHGNTVLKNFAHILYKFVTPGGLVARLSGDNFALVLRDYGDEELPIRTIKSVQEDFAKLAVDKLSSINLSCSAGYSMLPRDGNSFRDILDHAEFALKSTNNATGSICAYEPNMHDSIIGTTAMEKSIALAIENGELHLYYQPKIDLATGKIMGVEALIRWIKADGTVIPPDKFVSIAEKSGQIGKISDYVLNEGCQQNKLWQKMGYPNIIMSINFASSDFYQPDLKEKVLDALARSGLDPQWLEVELTESLALRNVDFAVSQMNKLRELGVKLAMDDFGTGYSSLSHLQKLPITLLKLDQSFIKNIEHDNIAYEIVSAVIRIAKSKKIETIAEGIENHVQESILRMAGCDYAQGYLYGKPMPPQELEKFFEENAKI